MKRQDITKVLEDLLKFEDVLACMVVKKGLDGILPQTIKIKNTDLWRVVHQTTNEMFDIIDRFYKYGLGRINLELGEYTILVAPINDSVSLIVITPSLANIGLLDVEIENAKFKIIQMAKTEEKENNE